MALVSSVLAMQLEQAFLSALNNTEVEPAVAAKTIANQIATAIDAYIKSATVQTTVTGTCTTAAGPGAIVGTGTGTLM